MERKQDSANKRCLMALQSRTFSGRHKQKTVAAVREIKAWKGRFVLWKGRIVGNT